MAFSAYCLLYKYSKAHGNLIVKLENAKMSVKKHILTIFSTLIL